MSTCPDGGAHVTISGGDGRCIRCAGRARASRRSRLWSRTVAPLLALAGAALAMPHVVDALISAM